MGKYIYEDSRGNEKSIDIQTLSIETDYDAAMYHSKDLAYTENDYDWKHRIHGIEHGLLQLVKQMDKRIDELEKRLAQRLPQTDSQTEGSQNATTPAHQEGSK